MWPTRRLDPDGADYSLGAPLGLNQPAERPVFIPATARVHHRPKPDMRSMQEPWIQFQGIPRDAERGRHGTAASSMTESQ
jgi:hypothetical protein